MDISKQYKGVHFGSAGGQIPEEGRPYNPPPPPDPLLLPPVKLQTILYNQKS